MGKDWMSELLKRRELKLQEGAHQAQLGVLAQTQGPDMFRRLCQQIQADLGQYSQATGDVVLCNFSGSTCEAKHDSFPTFWLQIRFEHSQIQVIQTTRKSSSAEPGRKEFTILVIGKAQDELYYRIDGVDYASEFDVSERLLAPLVESIG